MKHRLPQTTLYIIPACSSPQALVIRRGPSKWWHLLMWDRDTGRVKPGSWFNGKLYPERCDLSPRGDWMVLLAYRGHREPLAWTALCKPPSASAIGFWPQDSVKVGGGYFDERSPVVWINLHSKLGMRGEIREEQPYEIGYLEKQSQFYGQPFERMKRDGWKRLDREGGPVWFKKQPGGDHALWMRLVEMKEDEEIDTTAPWLQQTRYYLTSRTEKTWEFDLPGCNWANWNSYGRLCLAMDGMVMTADPHAPFESAQLVMDLNNLSPRGKIPGSTPPKVEANAQ